MKKIIMTVLTAALSAALSAAPFITPGMMKRNGLTNEQYERLWKLGKNPKLDVGMVRELMFKAGRYGNVTNWLDICGKTNDFAKLSYVLQDDNFGLIETNKVLVSSNLDLRVEVSELEPDAKALRKMAKSAQKAAEKDAKNYTKWLDDTKKAARKSSLEMAEFFYSIIDIATNAVPIPPNT